MLGIYILSTFVFTLFFHVEFILQAKSNFRAVFLMYLLKQAVFLCLITFLALFYEDSDKLSVLVLLQFISVFVATIFAYYIGRAFLKYSKPELVWVAQLWDYGKFVLATNVNSLIFRNTDHFMIAALISPTAVAYYNVAIRITNFLDLPSTAASEALFPKSVQLSNTNSGKENKKLYEVTVGVILASLIPLTLLIFFLAEEAITFIASEKYAEARPILQITLFYSLLLPFLKQFGMIMDSIGKPKLNTKLTIILSVSNFFFNYFLIKNLGLSGAAYGTLITYAIGTMFSLYFLHSHLKVSLMAVLNQIFHTYITLTKYTFSLNKKVLKD
jgi:O-antigen/teichoic acid export membrane protein